MTAEVALLSKVAVALAADSAATISAGDKDEKVFNTEDKLFELSDYQPIGVMIYGAPYFLETPIQILIKQYRALGRTFIDIDAAAEDFKKYLNDFGLSLDAKVRDQSYNDLVDEAWNLAIGRFSKQVQKIDNQKMADFQAIMRECVDFYCDAFAQSGKATFLDESAEAEIKGRIRKGKRKRAKQPEDDKTRGEAVDRLISFFLRSAYPSGKSLGIVIPGYGEKELFPSLRFFSNRWNGWKFNQNFIDKTSGYSVWRTSR